MVCRQEGDVNTSAETGKRDTEHDAVPEDHNTVDIDHPNTRAAHCSGLEHSGTNPILDDKYYCLNDDNLSITNQFHVWILLSNELQCLIVFSRT